MKSSIVLVVVCVGVMVGGCKTVNLTPEQEESIRQAAQKVLPQGSEISIDTQGQDVVIAAHLLEGHSSDERSPYVRGDYGTHEKLTRLVRLRSARVISSVLQDAQLTGVGGILIHTRHGVRQSYAGQSFSGTDVAMTLYTVRFAIKEGANGAPVIPTEEEIIQQFTVKKNIIPSLSFSRTPF